MRLSNDELWEKAGTDQPITMEDIELSPKENSTEVIHLHYSNLTFGSWIVEWIKNMCNKKM